MELRKNVDVEMAKVQRFMKGLENGVITIEAVTYKELGYSAVGIWVRGNKAGKAVVKEAEVGTTANKNVLEDLIKLASCVVDAGYYPNVEIDLAVKRFTR